MKKQTIQSILIFAHFCLMMIFLGGVFMENFISYPNWFYDIPASLGNANNFYQVRNPGQFFQTVFPLAILTGIGFVILGWKVKGARNFILMSLLLLICTEILTVIFIYPLIGVMVREGTAAHSVDFLKQTAQEFVRANQLRGLFLLLPKHFHSSAYGNSSVTNGIAPSSNSINRSAKVLLSCARLGWLSRFVVRGSSIIRLCIGED